MTRVILLNVLFVLLLLLTNVICLEVLPNNLNHTNNDNNNSSSSSSSSSSGGGNNGNSSGNNGNSSDNNGNSSDNNGNSTSKYYRSQPFVGNRQSVNEINERAMVAPISVLGTTASELQSCERIPPNAVVNNTIIVVAPFGGCSLERHIQLVEEHGALAVIVATTQAWKMCNTVDARRFNNTIPAICMSTRDIQSLLATVVENAKHSRATLARFTCDVSEYESGLNHAWVNTFTITFFVLFIAIAVVAAVRLVLVLFVRREKKMLPKVMLTIVIYCAVVSGITVIDLNGYRRWYNTMQFNTTYYFFFSTSGMYLFMIFSAHVTSVLARVSNDKRKLVQKINLVVTTLLITTYSVFNLVVFPIYGYSWKYTQEMGNQITIINCIITGVYSIFYFLSACFLIVRVRRSSTLKQQTNYEKMQRLYLYFSLQLFGAFFSILITFVFLILLTFPFVTEPIAVYFNFYFLLNLNSIVWLVLVLFIFKLKPGDANSRQQSQGASQKLRNEMNEESGSRGRSSFNKLSEMSVICVNTPKIDMDDKGDL